MTKAKYQLPKKFEEELKETFEKFSHGSYKSVVVKRAILKSIRKHWQMREMELKVVQPRKRSLLPWK